MLKISHTNTVLMILLDFHLGNYSVSWGGLLLPNFLPFLLAHFILVSYV